MTDPTPDMDGGLTLAAHPHPPSGRVPAPRPAAERRARRRAVEQELLAGAHGTAWVGDLASRFRVSVRTVWDDRRRVERRWEREDARGMARRRSAVVRRLERIAVAAETTGDHRSAIAANATLARILGLLAPASLNVLTVGNGQGPTTVIDLVRLVAAQEREGRVIESGSSPMFSQSG